MDNSRQTTPKSSPAGFVYFNTPTNQAFSSKNDTTEFLAFNDTHTSPPSHKFVPNCYSSPQPKFQHSSRNRDYPQSYRRPRRWAGGNRSYNSSQSYTNYSQNSSFKDEFERDISQFVHPSFLEDPWAHLELQLKNKRQNEATEKGSET